MRTLDETGSRTENGYLNLFFVKSPVFVVHLQDIFQEYGEPSAEKNLAELQGHSLQVHRNLVSHKVTGQRVRDGESEELPISSLCVCVCVNRRSCRVYQQSPKS